MKRRTFTLKAGLLGMPLEARMAVVDDLLGLAREECPEELQELLMDHGLLAVIAEFQMRYDTQIEDDDGLVYIPLKRGRRAYDADEFAEFLCDEPAFFNKLKAAVREVLFERFVEDAIAAGGRSEAA